MQREDKFRNLLVVPIVVKHSQQVQMTILVKKGKNFYVPSK